MSTFIVPVKVKNSSNEKEANMLGCSSAEKMSEMFKKYGYILWMHKQGCPRYEKGDTIYMYIGKPHQVIQFKAYVEAARVQATAEELQDFTWLTQEDQDKQIQNNCNDKFVLVKEIEEEKQSCLTLGELSKNGFPNPPYNPFPKGNPLNITDIKNLIDYVESVING